MKRETNRLHEGNQDLKTTWMERKQRTTTHDEGLFGQGQPGGDGTKWGHCKVGGVERTLPKKKRGFSGKSTVRCDTIGQSLNKS
jgi:hypothetical protein